MLIELLLALALMQAPVTGTVKDSSGGAVSGAAVWENAHGSEAHGARPIIEGPLLSRPSRVLTAWQSPIPSLPSTSTCETGAPQGSQEGRRCKSVAGPPL